MNVSDYIQNLDCIRQDEVLLKESFLYLLYYSQSTAPFKPHGYDVQQEYVGNQSMISLVD